MDQFDLGYDALSRLNPALTYTSVSNFGQTGPYRDWRGSEIIFYGMGGELYSTGVAEKEPLKLGGTVGLYQSGVMTAVATLGQPCLPPERRVSASTSISRSWKYRPGRLIGG